MPDRGSYHLDMLASYRRGWLVTMSLALGSVPALLPAGCGGGGSSAALDCDWLASENCWKTTTAPAQSCLPPSSDTGTFSADGKTCTYASGVVVTFATPVVFPIPDDPTWNFTVSNGGTDCLHYEETSSTLKVVVAGQTFSEGPSGSLGLKFTCPDGSSYSTSNAFDLLSCDNGGLFGGLPGHVWSSSDTSVSFGLVGTSASSFPVFSCHTP